jgi:hypothetical protein
MNVGEYGTSFGDLGLILVLIQLKITSHLIWKNGGKFCVMYPTEVLYHVTYRSSVSCTEVLCHVAYRTVGDQLYYVYHKLALSVGCRQFVAILGTIFTFSFVVHLKYFVDATRDFSHISVLFNDALGNKLCSVGDRWINVSMEHWRTDTDRTKSKCCERNLSQ